MGDVFSLHRSTLARIHLTMSKVVQKGVFDPREYKNIEKEWARKRKSEYLGPGKIYYTREFVRNPRYEPDQQKKDKDKDDDVHEVKIQLDQEPSKDIWPRRKKSDITRLYR